MLFMYIIISNIDFGVHLVKNIENISIHSLIYFLCVYAWIYDGKLAENRYMTRWGEVKFYFMDHHIIL